MTGDWLRLEKERSKPRKPLSVHTHTTTVVLRFSISPKYIWLTYSTGAVELLYFCFLGISVKDKPNLWVPGTWVPQAPIEPLNQAGHNRTKLC